MFQTNDMAQLASHEYGVLMRLYAQTQTRCSAHIEAQQHQIQQLQATVFQLRAQTLIRTTALCWEQETRLALQAQLAAWYATHSQQRRGTTASDAATLAADIASQRTTELLICQTGCVLDGNHWRDHDQCKRTGKPCLLVARPQALEQLHPEPHTTSQATVPSHDDAA
jgi:hypothetical protein